MFTFWKIWPPTPHRKNLHRSARNTNPVKSTRWSSRSPRTWRQTGWGEERSGRVLSPLLLCGELCCLTAAAGLRRKTFGIMSTASSTLSPPPASAAPLSCAISSSLWGSLPPHVSKVTETESLGFLGFFFCIYKLILVWIPAANASKMKEKEIDKMKNRIALLCLPVCCLKKSRKRLYEQETVN